MTQEDTTDRSPSDILGANLSKIHILCRRFNVRRLDLFGSAATGRFDPSSSDIDFLVEFEEPTASDTVNAYFALHEELEHLFGRSVDLLTLPALKNPYFRSRVLQERRAVFPTP